MKILMIHKYFFVNGGAERYLFELTKILERRGHEVVPFSMQHERNQPTPYERAFVSRVDFSGLSPLEKLTRGPGIAARVIWSREARRALSRLIEEVRPDVAHVHMIDHQLSPSVLHALKEHCIPTLQTLHQYKLFCPNYRLHIPRENAVCERCVGGNHLWPLLKRCHRNSLVQSAVVVAESYLHRWKRSYDQIGLFHAPSAFMASRLERSGVARERIWQRFYALELNDYPFSDAFDDYIVCFGRVSAEKGMATLVRAMAHLPGQRLKIVGEGPQLAELRQLATSLGLTHIEFTGFKSGAELRDIVSRARVVVVPSEWHDNSPLVIYEALSMGRPVVATSLGGMPELVRDGENGRIFPPGDVEALAQILTELTGDLPKLREMGRRGRAIAEAEFDPDAHCDRMLEKYAQLR